MGLRKGACFFLHCCWVLAVLCLKAHSGGSEIAVRFLKTPRAFSNRNYTAFTFEVLVGIDGKSPCTDCVTNCKLDDLKASYCEAGEVFYEGLLDGNHTVVVCAASGSRGVGCAVYNWTIDTIPPTASVTAATSFTSALNVSVYVSFSEPCFGFGCASANACNLLVYGAGQVMPVTLSIVQPNLKFSLLVSLSSAVQFGRVILVMDKYFCTDEAGNKFSRTPNSSFIVRFDRRSIFVNLRTHVPERRLQINGEVRTVLATNNYKKLGVYLYFTEPVLNSSTEVLKALNISQGSLIPKRGDSVGNRRFSYQVENLSSMAIVAVKLDSKLVISRQGTPVSPSEPITFLYDSQRPAVRLSTSSHVRTREHSIHTVIKFMKPVFGFNSSHVSISGGHLQSFRNVTRSTYTLEAQADGGIISISIPENATMDVAGNKNLASNVLKVRHYSLPVISLVISIFATAAFASMSFVAGLLTISTASLQSIGAFSRPSWTSDPGRNLFRIACHIQVFALSRWLAVNLPIEYYEFARGLQWSIPYFNLPWETSEPEEIAVGSSPIANPYSYGSKIHDSGLWTSVQQPEEVLVKPTPVYGLPLTPMEYRSIFESQHVIPEAEYMWNPRDSSGWRDFNRSMFWLVVIGGGLILVHILLLWILKFRSRTSGKQKIHGALTFPRFEIFLIILGLPCVCKASAGLVRGGASSGVIVGILLLCVVTFLLLALLLFLSIGITYGKLLQYKEVHQEGQKFHWFQDIIRVTLGPGKRGQWTWKDQASSISLTRFGPLFEDLRGPPKYMLSQISGGNPYKRDERIIASDDETEDAEAPFVQKLFGILRIYYTPLEAVKRICLGIVAGADSENWSSRAPTIALLSITSFQLFFMLLKKPFIKKKVQLVEIVSVSCEVGIFAACLLLLEKEISLEAETRIGSFMISLFLLTFISQMVNEWYALYRQIKLLDPTLESFWMGLRTAAVGFLLFLIPQNLIKKLDLNLPQSANRGGSAGDATSSGDKNTSTCSRSSGTTDKPWLRQLRELAKGSFSKEGSIIPGDPSTSRSGWSDLWGGRRSGSSSTTPSTDTKRKSKGLYKDLEAIFDSK